MKVFAVSTVCVVGVFFFLAACNQEEPCIQTTWYQDADEDGLGNPDISQSSCEQPDGFVANDSDADDTGGIATPVSAFDEFNPDAVSVSFDGNEITIESTGMPNHTSPYWDSTNVLHIEQTFGDHVTPGTIRSGSFTLTVSASPEQATSSSATGLGAIGISVTGAPIFNDQEGPNRPLDVNTATGFDYAGGHNGPSGYHYHIEAADVPENTSLSYDDEQLVGIMADGFLIYGRREMDGSYPTDLDESGGHYGVTQHSNGEEFYHYHIINEFYIGSYILLFGGELQGTPNTIF
ncbi:MAG: YHYH protein [Bacteroidota bacterium]